MPVFSRIRVLPAIAVAGGIALFIGIWEAAVRAFAMPRYLLPSPLDVAEVFRTDAALIARQSLVTAEEWAWGLMISVFFAFSVCSVCVASPGVRRILRPVLVASQAIPYLVFAPLLLLWLGLGMAPKVVLVVLTCVFPIALVWLDDLLRARAEYDPVCAMLKINPVRAFFGVWLPASLPGFFAGLKVSASYAVVSATLAELIGSEAGLGVYIIRAQSTYRTDRVMAAVVVVVVASLLSAALVEVLRARVVFWQGKARG